MNSTAPAPISLPIVAVRNLRKRYGAHEILRDLSFDIRRGEVFGLLGPNGAGKSTLIETLVGLRTPSGGRVRVLGMDPMQDRSAFTESVSVQPQAAALFPTLTVAETLQLFASFYGSPRDPKDVLTEFDLMTAAHTRVKHLSGGQRRRLLIGIAVIGNPEIIVLDEPSAGLDPAARHRLWEVIAAQRERGVTVILSTHHMDEATQVCDRIAILVAGKIATTGTPEELIVAHSRKATVTFFGESSTKTETVVAALEHTGVVTETRVTPEPTGYRFDVVTTDPDTVLRRVTFMPRLRATGFRVARNSLEDVFLQVSHDDN